MGKRLTADEMMGEVRERLTATYWHMSFTLDSWFFPADLCPHNTSFKYICKQLYELGLLERQGDGSNRWGNRYHIPPQEQTKCQPE